MAKKYEAEAEIETGTENVKRGFAKMVKGGIIMDVTNAAQAKIAEKAGAVAVMALERVPADIRAQGGVARMADPEKIAEIQKAVTIPVMAKARIGHFVEAQILEALGVDMIDESEVLTPADDNNHIDKRHFTIPFVCGAIDLGQALRRINEGAAMIRTKGEAGTGNIVEAITHIRSISSEINELVQQTKNKFFLEKKAKALRVPIELVEEVSRAGRLPVVNFAAGGIATPADCAMVFQMGCDGAFVGSGIFKSSQPERFAKSIVEAARNFNKPDILAKVSRGLGDAMPGLEIGKIDTRMQERGK